MNKETEFAAKVIKRFSELAAQELRRIYGIEITDKNDIELRAYARGSLQCITALEFIANEYIGALEYGDESYICELRIDLKNKEQEQQK